MKFAPLFNQQKIFHGCDYNPEQWLENPEILEKNQKYKLNGSVITYYQNYQKKVVREKYTLKDVTLERI